MKDILIEYFKSFYADFTNEVDSQIQEFIWSVLECDIYFINQKGHIRTYYREGQEFPDYKFLISAFCKKEEFLEYIEEFANDILRASMGRVLETVFISDRLPDGDVDTYSWES
jgi:hypothetical protein